MAHHFQCQAAQVADFIHHRQHRRVRSAQTGLAQIHRLSAVFFAYRPHFVRLGYQSGQGLFGAVGQPLFEFGCQAVLQTPKHCYAQHVKQGVEQGQLYQAIVAQAYPRRGTQDQCAQRQK